MEHWNDDIEFAVYCLTHPEMMAGEEFRTWIKTPEHRALFEEIRLYREAYMRRADAFRMDVEEEYRRFAGRTKRGRGRVLWRWCGAAAASVAVLLAVWFFADRVEVEEKTLAEAKTLVGRRTAELILASGERVELGGNALNIKTEDGRRIAADSCKRLSYREADVEGVMEEEPVYNTVRVPGGADYAVELADGTIARLNCETELRNTFKLRIWQVPALYR